MESNNWLDYLASAQKNVYAPNWGKRKNDDGHDGDDGIDADDIEKEIKEDIISSPEKRARIFNKYLREVLIGIFAVTVFFAFFAIIRAVSTSGRAANANDISSDTKKKTTKTSDSGTYSLSRDKDIFYELEVVSGPNVNNFGTPQNTAARWIVDEDELQLYVKSPNLRQRYVMVLLYFSLSGTEWTIGEGTWILSDTIECDWTKVVCNKNGFITSISLAQSNLRGKLPSELSELSFLTKLDLHSNHITGELPVELNSLVSLNSLYLEGNDIFGTVPDSICALRGITLEFFTTDCADEPPRVNCYCCTNCFSEIEQEGENGKTRKEKVTRKLQRMFPSLDLLAENSNAYNALGWILYQDGAKLEENSRFLGQRFLMALLYYSWNGENWPYTNWLSGGKEECMFLGVTCNDDRHIIGISLVSSELEGPIIEQLSYLEYLEELDLHNNHLHGTIPETLGQLSKLTKLLLHQNDLHGDVPISICLLRSSALLSEFRTDCSGASAEITCPCCSRCDTENENVGAIIAKSKDKAEMDDSALSNGNIAKQVESDTNNMPKASDSAGTNSILSNGLSSSQERGKNIKSIIGLVINGSIENSDVATSGSCHKDALDWIIMHDPMKVPSDYPTLIQRFVMIALYYCFDGSHWTDRTNWLSNLPECDWANITCDDNNHIKSVDLASNNLNGHIPYELCHLSELQILNLSRNKLVGTLPSSLANLYDLEKLYLFENNFDDFMPEEICYLTSDKLKDLRLDCNIPCDCCHQPCGAGS